MIFDLILICLYILGIILSIIKLIFLPHMSMAIVLLPICPILVTGFYKETSRLTKIALDKWGPK